MSCKLTDFVEFNPKRNVKKGEAYPYIEMASIIEHKRDVRNIITREFKGGGSKFRNGDTLLARLTPCLENGKSTLVHSLDSDGWGSTEFIVMSPKKYSDKDFVYYITRYPEFREYAIRNMSGTSGRQRVSWQTISQFSFSFPSSDYRKKAGTILRNIDDLISTNLNINRQLEELAKSIFKSWYVDFEPSKAKKLALQKGLSKQNIERAAIAVIAGICSAGEFVENTDKYNQILDNILNKLSKDNKNSLIHKASLFPDEYIKIKNTTIPKGWELKPIKDICRVINGRAYKNTEFKSKGTPIVRIQNLSGKGGKTVFSDLDLPHDKLIHNGDLIYAWSATFGPHIWKGDKSIYHYHIWKMDVSEDEYGKYNLYLALERLTEHLKSQGTGSIFTHLTKTIMEEQEVIAPPSALLNESSFIFNNIFTEILSNFNQIKKLEKLRDTLIPELISGRLNLNRINIDEIE